MTTTITNQHAADLVTDEERKALRLRQEREAQKAHYEAWLTGQDVDLHAQHVEHFFDGGSWELLCEDPTNGMLGKPTHAAVNSLGQTVFTFCRDDLAEDYAVDYGLTVVAL